MSDNRHTVALDLAAPLLTSSDFPQGCQHPFIRWPDDGDICYIRHSFSVYDDL